MRVWKCLHHWNSTRTSYTGRGLLQFNSTLFFNVYNKLYQLRQQLLQRFLIEKRSNCKCIFLFPTYTNSKSQAKLLCQSYYHANAHKPMVPVSLWLHVSTYIHLKFSLAPHQIQSWRTAIYKPVQFWICKIIEIKGTTHSNRNWQAQK